MSCNMFCVTGEKCAVTFYNVKECHQSGAFYESTRVDLVEYRNNQLGITRMHKYTVASYSSSSI